MTETPEETPQGNSLESLLAGLDDDARNAVMGEVKKARNEAASYRTQLREAQPKLTEYEQWVESQKSETEKLQGQVSQAQEAVKAANRRALVSEVKALAADSWADPGDAVAFLDVDKYIGTEGAADFDSERIGTDLKAILEKKPHLAKATDATQRGPKPDPSLHSSQRESTSNDPASVLQAFFANQLNRQ